MEISSSAFKGVEMLPLNSANNIKAKSWQLWFLRTWRLHLQRVRITPFWKLMITS